MTEEHAAVLNSLREAFVRPIDGRIVERFKSKLASYGYCIQPIPFFEKGNTPKKPINIPKEWSEAAAIREGDLEVGAGSLSVVELVERLAIYLFDKQLDKRLPLGWSTIHEDARKSWRSRARDILDFIGKE
jgi:hypothetical protein